MIQQKPKVELHKRNKERKGDNELTSPKRIMKRNVTIVT